MKRIIRPQTEQAEVDKFLSHKFNVTSFLFDQQLAFVEDPAPFKVAVCSRRAGKTVACAAHLIDTCLKTPDIMCLYITLSMKNAERIVVKDLLKINERYKLGAVWSDSKKSLTFTNNSVIYLCGANNVTEIENFRGVPLKLVYIDECQSFKAYIRELIDDILAPALMDYAGSLCLIGTPGPIPTGFFHYCAVKSADEAWSKHTWTFWDNRFIAEKSGKTHQQLLDRELRRRGVGANDPSIQREWFGKWVLDSDSLLIKYGQDKNDFQGLVPGIPYHFIMGIDIGWKDADAICILAYSDTDSTTFLVEELVTEKQGITELVQQIQLLDQKYKVNKMVMDFGGLGKKIGEEIIKRYQIPVEAADKVRKMENIELLNDALRTGRFKAKANSRFAQDSYLVEIDRDKSTPEKIRVSDRFHSDIIDSVLYAFKFSPAYAYVAPTKAPAYGSKEWAERQDSEMFERELEGHMKAEEYSKWLKNEN